MEHTLCLQLSLRSHENLANVWIRLIGSKQDLQLKRMSLKISDLMKYQSDTMREGGAINSLTIIINNHMSV